MSEENTNGISENGEPNQPVIARGDILALHAKIASLEQQVDTERKAKNEFIIKAKLEEIVTRLGGKHPAQMRVILGDLTVAPDGTIVKPDGTSAEFAVGKILCDPEHRNQLYTGTEWQQLMAEEARTGGETVDHKKIDWKKLSAAEFRRLRASGQLPGLGPNDLNPR